MAKHRVRAAIIESLKNGPKSVNEICEDICAAANKVSRYCQEIRVDGIIHVSGIEKKEIGRPAVIWSIGPAPFTPDAVKISRRSIKRRPPPVKNEPTEPDPDDIPFQRIVRDESRGITRHYCMERPA